MKGGRQEYGPSHVEQPINLVLDPDGSGPGDRAGRQPEHEEGEEGERGYHSPARREQHAGTSDPQ
jgi:hypothetical protein